MSFSHIKEEVEARGFCTAEAVFTPEQIHEAEAHIDGLMQSSGRRMRRFKRELADKTVAGGFLQPELARPALLSKHLQRSPVFARCREIAATVFAGQAHYLFDHAIYKMPRNETITPWHQDQAYLGEQVRINSLHFWIPFQDTGAENGSLRLVSGSHRVLLPHSRAFRNNPHLLSVTTPPTEDIHDLVLNKGDVSIHTNLTLHAAGANHSDHIRKAWVVHFGNRPAWYKRWLQLKSRFS